MKFRGRVETNHEIEKERGRERLFSAFSRGDPHADRREDVDRRKPQSRRGGGFSFISSLRLLCPSEDRFVRNCTTCDNISPPRSVIILRARETPSFVLREIPSDIRTGMLNAPFALA
jgi:hypothetical protein